MNIILINPYGPIPIPEEKWREYRFTIIGNYLSSLGHNVIWYTSSFSHHFKKQRSAGWKDIFINDNFKIRLVPTPGYDKNISFGRFFRDIIFSYKVYNYHFDEKPDLILYSESPLSFGYAGYKLARKLSVPVIYDQMDLWPELIINSFPKKMRKFFNMCFYPVFRNRKKVYSDLDGFISLAQPYMDIPMKIVPSLKNKPNIVIYNGIDVSEFRDNANPDPELLKKLPLKKEGELWYTFAGTLGPSYDILNLLDVAKKVINNKNNSIKFLIAGDGPLKKEVQEFSAKNGSETVLYLGKLKPESLSFLYSKSDVGLSIYTEISNVEMPDKFYDYTAAGLPVINSLKGEVGSIVEKERVGLNYIPGNTDSLFNTIIKLYDDEFKRKEYAENSYKIGSIFDKNLQIKKIDPFIDQVMKSFHNTN
ncbi:glycosyltransferase family 4 protein [Elizabethkingia bruuniana]|uniref:Glycosyltransferase family 4 protein n=1 Tax=Elizabethkingia bruuniana TaxID=1756149 RepID=A0A7T7UVN7_9FLAO|nr:glycosyltransferase family 4 protein [Elizabethkingia bruuniana]KGO11916.1 hypothetical protein KS04_01295 [Elizabethkingia miricola]AQX83652.1 hypothetical protein AYC65_00835 [Elizabethkingia bruuniana]KUY22233.1 hypothetical protein ATB97_13360 [Elizabethkingia bruuniana]OPB62444.1 hypothetical protein BAY12_11100 [Elizabethkingia bruuniana]QDZ63584.1 glycosyltransferase WbuB [Elizabethkingia bruuniana]